MSELPLHVLLVVAAAFLEAISKSDRLFTSETGLKLIEAFLKMRRIRLYMEGFLIVYLKFVEFSVKKRHLFAGSHPAHTPSDTFLH